MSDKIKLNLDAKAFAPKRSYQNTNQQTNMGYDNMNNQYYMNYPNQNEMNPYYNYQNNPQFINQQQFPNPEYPPNFPPNQPINPQTQVPLQQEDDVGIVGLKKKKNKKKKNVEDKNIEESNKNQINNPVN